MYKVKLMKIYMHYVTQKFIHSFEVTIDMGRVK